LRDIDIVNIITYSEESHIIKQGVSGDKKEILNESIKGLYAKGKTMGAQAILFSLDVALKHYLQDGNNQLFLITDGIFKFTDEHYEKWKQKVGDHKIVLSIVGLGKDAKAITQLQEMATKRQGTFIWLNNHQDAKTLVLEEIKVHAKK
jgi:Mg-chelatase subunit ChlD